MKISDSLPICLNKNEKTGFFDEIRIGRFTRISFHRTLRIPDDGKDYPLPAGLGRFPIHRVEDYADKVPSDWLKEGGFFIPLYQKEALFLEFEGPDWHPTIAKVCVGRINAITGKNYTENLSSSQQDYVVIPDQKWLDGIATGKGTVNQFVAMPLGQGYTIEAQITDEEKFGGFQLLGFEANEGRFPERDPAIDERIRREERIRRVDGWRKNDEHLSASELSHTSPHSGEYNNSMECLYASELSDMIPGKNVEMGIAAGGSIKQQIYPDAHGFETWDKNKKRSITIHLVNSLAFKAITGMEAPPSPITIQQYQKFRIPWYSYYDETIIPIKPPSIFKRILSIAKIDAKRGVSEPQKKKQMEISPELIKCIKTPSQAEAVEHYRKDALKDAEAKRWKEALRNISMVIDLQSTKATSADFVLRSSYNFHLENYSEGFIDAVVALERDVNNVDALTWRASCQIMSLQRCDKVLEDMVEFSNQPKYFSEKSEFIAQAVEFGYDLVSESWNNSELLNEYNMALPSERLCAFVKSAQCLIKAGVISPRDLGVCLDRIAASKGKPKMLRKYSVAFWHVFKVIDPTLNDPSTWEDVYCSIDEELI